MDSHETVYLAYLAGFFDGEGCIAILKNRFVRKDCSIYHPRYDLSIAISNQNLEVLLDVHKTFGGSITNHPNAYQWRVSALSAKAFLEAIQPYIRVKKTQLELALIFQELKSGRRSRTRLTDKELTIYEAFYRRMSELNKQGSRAFHLNRVNSGKPLPNNVEDNPEPNSSNDIEVEEKVQRLTSEESTNNLDTSARPEKEEIVRHLSVMEGIGNKESLWN